MPSEEEQTWRIATVADRIPRRGDMVSSDCGMTWRAVDWVVAGGGCGVTIWARTACPEGADVSLPVPLPRARTWRVAWIGDD